MDQRFDDWRERLISYLAETVNKPFQYGENDCALFAAGAVAAMTGVDLAAQWRGQYTGLEDGLNALAAAGYVSHVDIAERHFDEIAPAFAAAGDLAVLEGPAGDALGVVQGEGIYVLTAARMGVLPLTFAKRAFRVK